MANIISKNFNDMVSPKGGKAMWCKINSKVDEYEGKKKYSVKIYFDDKATEQKMKNLCDDLIAKAKADPQFADKKWRASNDRCGYTEQDDGSLQFNFQTGAYFRDKETGEMVQKFIPILNAQTRKKLDNSVMIGNGSEMRIEFTPMAYWMTKDSNGLNLYIKKAVVDKLIEFGGGDDFSAFGIEMESEADEFKNITTHDEDEFPI